MTLQVTAVMFIGMGATLVMDLWGYFQKKVVGVPPLNYCLVGRWLCHMPNGKFAHQSIFSAASKPGECTVGWVAHYAIGIAFAGALVLIASPGWIQQPTLVPALLVGLATIAIPFLVMQPAFGLGIAAAKTPNPRRTRMLSLAAHTSFGLGLYLAALAFSPVLGG
ncbi:DUF2938 domain-containing protein [Alcanivorax sp. JB21]|uniref:DUF2938 domain-containing protein n=1 Tax=Alcanivorax limicola TaxID=2874102 RepID=UPI001CBB140B|nr:DUF2938 domain-containing protein [Alcanivorax limicola]MBZ2188819.1 DUF2938 domain-containing protein [Alcanivorax limicola]